MNPQATHFLTFVKNALPAYFKGKLVLDVGSGDINGNSRGLFENCIYMGNDVTDAPNVTIVCKTKDLPMENEYFDTIISSECFEHDPEYRESFIKIFDLLEPNGLFCFTCASTGRPEHGTARTSPADSYGTIADLSDMKNYYKNLTPVDLNEVLDINASFSRWNSYYNAETRDFYFMGIKKGNIEFPQLPIYTAPHTMKTCF